MATRTAIYCRLSQEDQRIGESESIQNQREMLLKYAADRAWFVSDIYADDDWSGASQDRPEWNRMLADCENGKIDIVLCKNQSRFSRDMEVVSKYIHRKFPIWGVRFVGMVDNIDSDKQETKKMGQILGLTNEWYLEEISNNVRSVFKTKMQKGEWLATYAPYGYKKDPSNKHHLIIDPEKAKIVRQIFDWRLEGLGYNAIAKRLNLTNVPPPSEKSDQWAANSVRNILFNPMYVGDCVQGRRRKISYKSKLVIPVPKEEWVIVPNTHEAIIDREKYKRLEGQFAKWSAPNKSGKVYSLSGKIKCSCCGKSMRRYQPTRGETRFRCDNKYIYKTKCNSCTIKASELEELVKRQLIDVLKSYEDGDYAKRKAEDTISQKERLIIIDEALRKISRATTDAFLSKSDGVLSPDVWKSISQDLQEQRFELEKEKKEILERIENNEKWKSKADIAEKAIHTFIKDNKLTHGLIADLVDKVIIGGRDENGDVPIEVKWTI